MRRTLFVFSIFVLFLVSACSKKPESKASVEVIDGIEHVHNTGTPLHPDKSVTFEEELSIGGEEYEMLSRPMRFIVDREGKIYISDSQDQTIKVFNQNTFLPDGKLLAMDSRARRLNFFDPEGNYLTSYHWIQNPGRLQYATDSACVMTVYTFQEGKDPLSGRKLFVKKFDFEGEEICSFGEFKTEEGKVHTESRSGGGGVALLISLPYAPHSIFASDPVKQYLYHCVNNEYMIEVFDKDGKVIRRFDRPYEPLSFTSEDAKEFRSRYEDSTMEGLKKMVQGMSMPSVKTITPQMLVDDVGNLWVETHEQREEEEKVFTAYDIFNPDGYYEAKVWIDLKPEIFMNGRMYRFHTDEETGYRFVKRYRVVWNK